MDPLVSILIPAYNAEKWIKDTIESALNQTWPNKEIIIVDDGSTDNTLKIIKGFESMSVKVVVQENKGAPAARNRALSFAQGDYIQWLDNDDLLAPGKISQQVEYSYRDQNPLILYSGPFGRFYYCYQKAKFVKNSLWQDLTPLDYFLFKFTENIWLQPGAWLVSRKLTELAGPYYDVRSPDDDGEYFCRVVAASERIKFVPEAKAYWRIGNFGSLSYTRSKEALEALFISISRSIDHLRSLEDSEKTRSACLKYLQDRLWYFYPEKYEILEKAQNLAEKLGGNLSLPPDEGWKFSLLMNIFGWKMTMNLRNIAYRAETSALRNWDRFMYKLYLKGIKPS
jgi:glycosyltransferase involved in cell wall biosynthesis